MKRAVFFMSTTAAIVLLTGQAYPQMTAGQIALQRYLEGKQVITKIDMPAARDGINVYPERSSLDQKKQRRLIQHYGVAVPTGQSARITRVWFDKSILVIELDGGGVIAGPDWDEAAQTPVMPMPTRKSDREISLERQLASETNAGMAGSIRTDLEAERRRRQRQDDLNAQDYEQAKRRFDQDLAARRLHAGSRLNLIFEKTKTAQLSPDKVVGYLRSYVDFPAVKMANRH